MRGHAWGGKEVGGGDGRECMWRAVPHPTTSPPTHSPPSTSPPTHSTTPCPPPSPPLPAPMQVSAHGTGARIPPVDDQVVSLRLVSPALGAISLSETEEPELFRLAKVGLGALGVVTQVRGGQGGSALGVVTQVQ